MLADEQTRAALEHGIAKMVRSYNETTLKQLKKVLGEKLTQQGGTNLPELTQAVKDVYSLADERRAGLVSVGRNITDICRDMGVVPGLCTRTFWDALRGAIIYYQGNLSDLWNDQPRRLQQLRQEQEASASEQQDSSPEHKIPSKQQEIPSPQPIDLQVALHPERTLGFRIGEPPVDPSGESPAQPDTGSRNVSGQQRDSAATGPPPPPAMKRAA